MAGIGYTLNGERFPTKEAVKARVQGILNGGAIGQPLGQSEERIMLDLLAHHYDAKSKIGCGVARIEIRRSPEYGSKTFYIVRKDGSTTDFSYTKCLESHPAEHKFIDACRHAVKPHIDWYRAQFFRTAVKPTCPLTGQPLTLENAHVDHCPPFTFERIVSSFAMLIGVDQDNPALVRHGDNLTIPLLANDLLRDRFVQYHNNVAQLRVVSDQANITLVTGVVRKGLDNITPEGKG